MTRNQLTSPAQTIAYIFAGNATFTLLSLTTGVRFTYKIQGSSDGRMWFVSLLTGPGNWDDYTYAGFIPHNTLNAVVSGRKGLSPDAPSMRAINWFLRAINTDSAKLDQIECWHEGRCGRCNRKLTVPSSIESGLGPTCAKAA